MTGQARDEVRKEVAIASCTVLTDFMNDNIYRTLDNRIVPIDRAPCKTQKGHALTRVCYIICVHVHDS